ncbi:unnamed protein product [Allacma fusca]|uniref:Methyltransferase FkbM domain-containing protein n=1 Tax=Allacma fusca TaxID=39272 RepID=A0A8J2PRK8_9HEXA|nr:unnamed protein product [Allacma fusca]
MPFHFVRVDYAARRKILLLLLILMLFGCYKLMPSLSNSEQEIHFELTDFSVLKSNQFPPTHPVVLNYLRGHHMTPPSKLGYKFPTEPIVRSQHEKELRQIFSEREPGFFVECGAHDGEFYSNTLELELLKNWTGLLIEMDPKLLKSLKTKHRNAWIAGVCVSPHNNFTELELIMGDQINYWSKGETFVRTPGNMNDKEARNLKKSGFMVECFPLVSQLAAINITHVDFLSLDVQGLEMDILATILVDSGITVDYILAEHTLIPNGKNSMKEFLISKGYELIFDHFNDFLFKRRIINTN